jgi:hypothetical protein
MITSDAIAADPVDGNALLSQQASTPPPSTPSPVGENLLSSTKPAEPAPASSPWVNDKGEFSEGWLDRLPKELAEHKQILGQFKDIDGALKTLVSQQKMLGKKADAILIPDDKATPEEKAAFLKKLGVPESPDAYQLRPKDLPAGFEWDENMAKEFNTLAHQNGITPKQMDALMGRYAALESQRAEAAASQQKSEMEAGRKALAEAWGDKYDVELSVARRAAQVAGVDVNSKGFSDPSVVLAFNRLARMMSDDKIVNSDTAGTMMAGKARAMDIMTNPSNPLHGKYASGDKTTADLVSDLLKNG